MKEALIKLLGLPTDATEEQIIETVNNLKELATEKIKSSDAEKAIRNKIQESGGALNREQAILAITQQKQEDAKAKK